MVGASLVLGCECMRRGGTSLSLRFPTKGGGGSTICLRLQPQSPWRKFVHVYDLELNSAAYTMLQAEGL